MFVFNLRLVIYIRLEIIECLKFFIFTVISFSVNHEAIALVWEQMYKSFLMHENYYFP